MLFRVAHSQGHVDAFRIIDATMDVAQANDCTVQFVQEACRDTADVTKSLDDDRRFVWSHAQGKHSFTRNHLDATRSCFKPAFAATNGQRFPSDHSWYGIALVHGIGIHDPGHDLGIRVHIWSGNITIGANQDRNLGSIAACKTFEFGARELVWIADDTAFSASEGNIDDGALPGHPHGQGTYFVLGNFGAKADAAFGRAAIDVVLYAVARKHFHVSIVHAHGEINDEFAFRFAQNSS